MKLKSLLAAGLSVASLSAVAAPFVVSNLQATGGTIDGTTVGATSPSTGRFTTFTATTSSLFSGNVVMQYPTATTQRQLAWLNNTSTRWVFLNDGGTESGGNAGSNFAISRYNDAGTFIDNPIFITRSTGVVTFADGMTVTAGAIVPNQTAGITGTTTNNNANAGAVGEYQSQTSGVVALTNGTPANVISVSLTAGDWDVSGAGFFDAGATTTISNEILSISTTSATLGPLGALILVATTFPNGSDNTWITPTFRVSIASTTTVFLVAQAGFGVSTMAITGTIRARRVR